MKRLCNVVEQIVITKPVLDITTATVIIDALVFSVGILADCDVDGLTRTGKERDHVEAILRVVGMEILLNGIAGLELLIERAIGCYLKYKG